MTKSHDLVLERVVDVSPELVWKAWTQPKHLMPWFCPKPWSTVECRIDLKPGGEFYTVMANPEGERMPGMPGCYLEVVPHRKLVWTNALSAGWRPTDAPVEHCPVILTCVLTFEPHGKGCKYTATALHKDQADSEKHAAMGFHEGWGTALTQLVEYIRSARD